MKLSDREKIRKTEREFTEGITAMMAGLASVILGATVLNLPKWSAAIFIPMGILSYVLGLRWYKRSK